ncbi:hypothetical protein DSCW_21450 [Desulfosarcina widdelii]|uniref:Uncharacterized protein n=1 Tax=Desulfosarcina widdelii TaxID=947919 RepID=A0A5K7Z1E1_9BACT|nr:hypothetical protein DSCW_21450 [Desulfosarcina widdelii]
MYLCSGNTPTPKSKLYLGEAKSLTPENSGKFVYGVSIGGTRYAQDAPYPLGDSPPLGGYFIYGKQALHPIKDVGCFSFYNNTLDICRIIC